MGKLEGVRRARLAKPIPPSPHLKSFAPKSSTGITLIDAANTRASKVSGKIHISCCFALLILSGG